MSFLSVLYEDVLHIIAEFADDRNVMRVVCRNCSVIRPEKVQLAFRARRCFVMGYKKLGKYYYKMLGKNAFHKLKAVCREEYYYTIPPEIIAENLDEGKTLEEVPVSVYIAAAFDDPAPIYKSEQIHMIAVRYAWLAGKKKDRNEFFTMLLAIITMSDNSRCIKKAFTEYMVMIPNGLLILTDQMAMELMFLALVFDRFHTFRWLREEKFPKLSLCKVKLYEARNAVGDNYRKIMMDIADRVSFHGAPSDLKQYVVEKIIS